MGETLRLRAENREAVLGRAAEVLRGGGIIVLPTDSVYGIGCLATAGNPAHERIFRVKRRDRGQSLPWLIEGQVGLERYGRDVPAWAGALSRRWWPGALTLVVRASAEVPREYRRSTDGTVALRVPGSRLDRDLMRLVGAPIANTSANTHGRDAAVSGESVEDRIVREVDLTIDAGPAPLAVASTIVGCAGEVPVLLREGAVSAADIEGELGIPLRR